MQDQELVKIKDVMVPCFYKDGVPYVVLKPIIDAIGVHADSAMTSIKNDEILRDVHAVERVRDASGRLNYMASLPIEHVHGWLFSIDVKKVKKEVQPRLIEFKRECYKILFNHFYGRVKVYDDNVKERHLLVTRNKQLNRIIHSAQSLIKRNKEKLNLLDLENMKQLNLFVENNTDFEPKNLIEKQKTG